MLAIFVIFLVCTISGILTGLLGIGGGLIIVPFFMSVFPLFGISDFSLQQIVAISATCVFINSAAATFYRRGEEYLAKDKIVKLSAAIIFGTVAGSYLASFAPDKVIYGIYLLVCVGSIYLMKTDFNHEIKNSRLRVLIYPIFALIGAISSSIGIGGAVLFATALKFFVDNNTKKLLPTITLLVLIHSFFAFSSKFVLGEVTLFIIPIAIISSLVGSKIGIVICKKTSCKAINNMMIAVLLLGIFRIGIEFFK